MDSISAMVVVSIYLILKQPSFAPPLLQPETTVELQLGGGESAIFIYSCFVQRISFEINLACISKEICGAQQEYSR